MDMRKLLSPLVRRIENLVSRATVSLVNDGAKVQTVQLGVLDGETRGDVERMQEYGFTSVPLVGAEAVVVWVGGRRDHGLVVAVDDRRHRPTGLQPGEVAIYTDEGDSVVIKRGGHIVVTGRKITLDAPAVEVAGATASVAKGESLNAAVANLGTAVAAALAAAASAPGSPVLGAAMTAASASVASAVAAFNAAAQAALSQKAKVG
jgi:phage baseplate assembly protein V